jgi:EAL domain-containing protein (putative c-di-GMP-specific phosphodiesterase class I)
VNLSSAQFMNRHLIPTVMSALAASGLAAGRLELEITESVLLQDADATLAVLQKLREIGVKLIMDDFGTGYFSLSHLRKFRFDKIKIDQSFVRDMFDHDVNLAIVRAVVAMCSGLRIGTVAEGVETSQQLERLKSEGCTEAQGYLFSRPRSAADVKTWLAAFAPQLRTENPSSGSATSKLANGDE